MAKKKKGMKSCECEPAEASFQLKRAIRTDSPTSTTVAESQPPTNNVRKFRHDHKWTQWQLAEISRLSERTIQRVEAGGPLGVTAELALAAAFGIEVSDLYRRIPGDPEDFMLLMRIVSGNLLLDLTENAVKGSYDVEDLRDDEITLAREFIHSLTVWLTIWRDKDPSERVAARHIFTSTIDELDSKGLCVFVGPANLTAGTGEDGNREVKIGIFRSGNPRIIQPGPLRQLGKEMCCMVVGASPRDLDPRLVRPMTKD